MRTHNKTYSKVFTFDLDLFVKMPNNNKYQRDSKYIHYTYIFKDLLYTFGSMCVSLSHKINTLL